MSKRRELAALGALACGAAVGVILVVRVRRAPRRIRSKRPALPNRIQSLALPNASGEQRPPEIARPSQPSLRRRSGSRTKRFPSTFTGAEELCSRSPGLSTLLGGTALIAFAFVTRRVTALAAPTIAYPGSTAVISYAAAGFGKLTYRLDAVSGGRSGALASGDGTFGVSIVPRDADSDIVVVIRTSGPLGSDARVARIRVLPRPRARVLTVPSKDVHIDAFSLSAANVPSGDTIVVRYRSNATSGHVLLRDARGGCGKASR